MAEKGKKEFTVAEKARIVELIKTLEKAASSKRKGIRDKLRDIGLFWHDFENGSHLPYTVENFEKLIEEGAIRIVGESVKAPAKKQESAPVAENKEIKEEPLTEGDNVKRGLEAWVDENSEILILGSVPGDESLRQESYYCKANNSFWKIVNEIFGRKEEEKDNKKYILEHHLALWDCVKSCERKGSLDADIKAGSEKMNDLPGFLNRYPAIRTIVFNGTKAEEYFNKNFPELKEKYDFHQLISTSGAAPVEFKEKLEAWRKVLAPEKK